MRNIGVVCGLLLALVASLPAQAAYSYSKYKKPENCPYQMGKMSRAPQPSLLSVGVGYFDAFKNEPRDEAADFRLEYRSGYSLTDFAAPYMAVRPMVGIEVTSDGGVYIPAGFMFDVPLAGGFYMSPNFNVGVFIDEGGKSMGSFIEFRSTIEVGYEFDNRSRLSVALGHISNANITEHNPGSEIVTVYYHMPFDRVFGR